MTKKSKKTRQKRPKCVPQSNFKDIPPLTGYYHKARNQYVLFSALLIAWTLIGAKIISKQLADYVPIFVDIGLTYPDLIPISLIALMFFAGTRIIIEWKQVNENRRKLSPVKLDFYIAHSIAGVAVLFFIANTLSLTSLVDFSEASFVEMCVTFGIGLSFPVLTYLISKQWLEPNNFKVMLIILLFCVLIVLLLFLITGDKKISMFLISAFFDPILWALVIFLSRKFYTKKERY